MAIRVGRWDCTTCGHVRNLGPETRCVACSAPRPPGVKFYLATDAEIVQDEKRLREAKAGTDWICGHCEAQNKAADTTCYSCGNLRDAESEDVDLESRVYHGDSVPKTSEQPEDRAGERYRREHQALTQKPKSSPVRTWLTIGLVLVGLFMAGNFFLRSFPKDINVEIQGFAWERIIQFEHYEPVDHEDWDTPRNAFDVSSFRAIHHYDKVFRGYETRTRTVQVQVGEDSYVCGQRDMGNGYFEDVYCTRPVYESRDEQYEVKVYDDVPVYATKYRYKLMEWTRQKHNRLAASGKDHEPRWPNAPAAASREPDKWREGPKEETYEVIVREDDGDVHKHVVNAAFWTKCAPGAKLKASKSRIFDQYYGLTETNYQP